MHPWPSKRDERIPTLSPPFTCVRPQQKIHDLHQAEGAHSPQVDNGKLICRLDRPYEIMCFKFWMEREGLDARAAIDEMLPWSTAYIPITETITDCWIYFFCFFFWVESTKCLQKIVKWYCGLTHNSRIFGILVKNSGLLAVIDPDCCSGQMHTSCSLDLYSIFSLQLASTQFP